jgi:hypothetical protein
MRGGVSLVVDAPRSVLAPGHPYRNDTLSETRAEQRRVLRSIPDWIVDNVRLSAPAPRLGDPDDALVERELRRLADRELEQLDGWLDVWREHTESEVVQRWFARAEVGAALEEIAGIVRDEHETARVADYPPGLFPVILRVVGLLAWADELAADYADPRLRRYHDAWRRPPVPEPPRARRPEPRPASPPMAASSPLRPPNVEEFWRPRAERARSTR